MYIFKYELPNMTDPSWILEKINQLESVGSFFLFLKDMWLLLSTNDNLPKYQFSRSREVHGSRAVHELRYKLGLAEIFLFPFPIIFVYKDF